MLFYLSVYQSVYSYLANIPISATHATHASLKVRVLYGLCGFRYRFFLSTRPADKFIGKVEDWDNAEDALRRALDEVTSPSPSSSSSSSSSSWSVKEGDGAFYGPKVDVHVTDALGREHQVCRMRL